MAEFDSLVKKEQEKLNKSSKPSIFDDFKKIRYEGDQKPAYCLINGQIDTQNWPTRFSEIPRRFDLIESKQGRRLEVKSVIYKITEKGTITILELGKPGGEVTPTGGGSGMEADDF